MGEERPRRGKATREELRGSEVPAEKEAADAVEHLLGASDDSAMVGAGAGVCGAEVDKEKAAAYLWW